METEISIQRSQPVLTTRKETKVGLSCPTCSKHLEMGAEEIDFGNVITCPSCQNKTYYPFEKPWYRKRKLVLGYATSLIISFVAGLLVKLIFG